MGDWQSGKQADEKPRHTRERERSAEDQKGCDIPSNRAGVAGGETPGWFFFTLSRFLLHIEHIPGPLGGLAAVSSRPPLRRFGLMVWDLSHRWSSYAH
jgi:hypothetical protein